MVIRAEQSGNMILLQFYNLPTEINGTATFGKPIMEPVSLSYGPRSLKDFGVAGMIFNKDETVLFVQLRVAGIPQASAFEFVDFTGRTPTRIVTSDEKENGNLYDVMLGAAGLGQMYLGADNRVYVSACFCTEASFDGVYSITFDSPTNISVQEVVNTGESGTTSIYVSGCNLFTFSNKYGAKQYDICVTPAKLILNFTDLRTPSDNLPNVSSQLYHGAVTPSLGGMTIVVGYRPYPAIETHDVKFSGSQTVVKSTHTHTVLLSDDDTKGVDGFVRQIRFLSKRFVAVSCLLEMGEVSKSFVAIVDINTGKVVARTKQMPGRAPMITLLDYGVLDLHHAESSQLIVSLDVHCSEGADACYTRNKRVHSVCQEKTDTNKCTGAIYYYGDNPMSCQEYCGNHGMTCLEAADPNGGKIFEGDTCSAKVATDCNTYFTTSQIYCSCEYPTLSPDISGCTTLVCAESRENNNTSYDIECVNNCDNAHVLNSCLDYMAAGELVGNYPRNGWYYIKAGKKNVKVYCDMDSGFMRLTAKDGHAMIPTSDKPLTVEDTINLLGIDETKNFTTCEIAFSDSLSSAFFGETHVLYNVEYDVNIPNASIPQYVANWLNAKTPTGTDWTPSYDESKLYFSGALGTFGDWSDSNNSMFSGCDGYTAIGKRRGFRTGGAKGHTGEWIHTACNDYTRNNHSITELVSWNGTKAAWLYCGNKRSPMSDFETFRKNNMRLSSIPYEHHATFITTTIGPTTTTSSTTTTTATRTTMTTAKKVVFPPKNERPPLEDNNNNNNNDYYVCSSLGDPHFVTFTGHRYDHYGIGFYNLFTTEETIVNVLHQKWGMASANKAVIIMNDDDDTNITIYGREGQMRAVAPALFDGESVENFQFCEGNCEISIDGNKAIYKSDTGVSVHMTLWSTDFININVKISKELLKNSNITGLCGTGDTTAELSESVDIEPVMCSNSGYTFKMEETCESLTMSDGNFAPNDECDDVELKAQAERVCAAAGDLQIECVKDVCATGDLNAGNMLIDGVKDRGEIVTPPDNNNSDNNTATCDLGEVNEELSNLKKEITDLRAELKEQNMATIQRDEALTKEIKELKDLIVSMSQIGCRVHGKRMYEEP
eukprot:m.296969 g.296969  ORF g.296969 m.296969 type:complete len:1111 (-) comp16395_c3_seq7:140-3472(-)